MESVQHVGRAMAEKSEYVVLLNDIIAMRKRVHDLVSDHWDEDFMDMESKLVDTVLYMMMKEEVE